MSTVVLEPPATQTLQRFVLLPPRGLRSERSSPSVQAVFAAMKPGMSSRELKPIPPKIQFRVLDSIRNDGAKLIEMPAEQLAELRAAQPDLKIASVMYYTIAVAPRPKIAKSYVAATVMAAPSMTIRVCDAANGAPISGATVIAFSNFEARTGAQGTTDQNGSVTLALGSTEVTIERLYVYPKGGWWPLLGQNVTLDTGAQIQLTAIDLGYQDSLRYCYRVGLNQRFGKGIRIGVIDTGVGPHQDLKVAGGLNTVTGENPSDFGDNGVGHGTHVAGIIAARGTPPTGIIGLAPEAEIRSYRAFAAGSDKSENFAIGKALDQAINDQCDLINMSLGGGPSDPVLEQALDEARLAGSIVICAAGNDYRSAVSFPGSYTYSVAVSAFGREGTYPAGAAQAGNILRPPDGQDPLDFIADFSNVGPEIDLTGPGVGIISTFPGGYAVLDGTSMACPAVTGAAARILSQNPAVLQGPRDQNRVAKMLQTIHAHCISMGFGPTFEGKGRLQT